MTGLAALEAELAHQLDLLNLPAKAWLTPKPGVVDVAIIGGGLSGLCAAAALRFIGLGNIVLLDRAPAGREGPWVTYARMRTLRTAKEITGPALGVPALTPRAWFEAQFGARAWTALDRIPRAMWMEYLVWYRRVLDLPVRNDTEVTAITPQPDGLLALGIAGQAAPVLARRVVLATGLDGLGAPYVPPVVKGIDRRFWAHSADDIDMTALVGKRVGVVGAGASAMDNAAAALEAGAASVDLLIRRDAIPRMDRLGAIAGRGTAYGFQDLPAEVKWSLFRQAQQAQLPPPRHSVLRVSSHANARFHVGSPIEALSVRAGALLARTPKGDVALDFLIFATGFAIDIDARPELAVIGPHIRRWADTHRPEAGREDAGLAAHPDLGPGFELQERVPGACPALQHISAFNYPAVLTHGKLTSGIPSVAIGAQRLAEGLARSLYVEDVDDLQARFAAYDKAELNGDEWMPAPNPSDSEPAHA
ncbi:NAD(P)-binding domain-containing protein [Humitalea sp. 24SJ18S-53]|uniref:NAD(P)-binding domain-containing protein n=1 Tax=Humitalea sp. 24SJ18S-53 TaxID=3422307 RepID=UPI003D670A3B